jgi:bifunctional non-homologous end joining protein LigD
MGKSVRYCRTSFHALQSVRGGTARLVYFVLDLLWHRGEDIRSLGLEGRKAQLRAAIGETHDRIVYLDHLEGDGPTVHAEACRIGAEGIVSKIRSAAYETGARSKTWLKNKCVARQEFVIDGFTDPTNPADRAGIGALLVGVFDEGGVSHFVRQGRDRLGPEGIGAASHRARAAGDRADAIGRPNTRALVTAGGALGPA